MVEDINVILYSWEYLADFMILSPKATLGVYPIILGRPWLATIDAYIGCRSGNMTISNGITTKTLTLYSLAQPQLDQEKVVCPDIGEEAEEFNFVQQLMMLTRESFIELQEDDSVLSNIIENHYGEVQYSCGIPTNPLHTLVPSTSSLDSPAATDIFHTLLP